MIDSAVLLLCIEQTFLPFFPEDFSDVRAVIVHPGHALSSTDSRPSPWLDDGNGAGFYDVVSGLLLCAKLTGCCRSHSPSVHCRTE